MALIGEMKYLTIGGKTYQIPVPESGSSVEFTPNLTSGTKVGDLTIDGSSVSLYAPTNTDTKLQIAAVTSGTTYYPVVAANSTTAATRQYDATGLAYAGTNGTTSTVGTAKITLGNSTASGTINNKKGQITLYGSTAYATTIDPGSPTATRTITLPNATGTVALTSDISDEKLKTDAIADTDNAYYPIFGSNNSTASTKYYSTNFRIQDASTDTYLTLGTINSKNGQLNIVKGAYVSYLSSATLTASRSIQLPNKGGTIALTSDIPTVPSAGSSASAVGTSSSGGSATTWSRSDHVHNINSTVIGSAGGVTGVKINGTTYSPTSGTVDLGTISSTAAQIIRW